MRETRPIRALFGALPVAAAVAFARMPSARAAPTEGEEEIIDDPLSRSPKEPATATASASPTSSAASERASSPAASSAPELHLDVWARLGVDTRWTRDEVAPSLGEDVARARLRTTIGVTGGDFAAVRYALEVRMQLEARAKRADSGVSWPLARATYLYEAIPTAAWVEVPIGKRIRVRAGEQVVSWGRMDLASAADVLDRRDLREGPSSDPAGLRLPTPTVRADVALSRAFDLTLAWSVVSLPHRFDLLGTSWALLGPGVLGVSSMRERIDGFASSLDQTTFVRLQQSLLDASSPVARVDGGDVALRASAHAGGADVAFTYGYVRTKLPVIDVDPALKHFRGEVADGIELLNALNAGRPLIVATYPRYHQLALDLEGTAGPFTLSWELGFTPSRPLFVADPSGFPRRADSGLAQVGVRAQYADAGDEAHALIASVEIEALEATSAPPEGAGPYLVFGRHRALLAALGTLGFTLGKKHVFDAGIVVTSSGPSVALLPRYGYELDDAFTIGAAGGFFPRLRGAPSNDGASEALTLADVQAGRDYVELYARYRR